MGCFIQTQPPVKLEMEMSGEHTLSKNDMHTYRHIARLSNLHGRGHLPPHPSSMITFYAVEYISYHIRAPRSHLTWLSPSPTHLAKSSLALASYAIEDPSHHIQASRSSHHLSLILLGRALSLHPTQSSSSLTLGELRACTLRG